MTVLLRAATPPTSDAITPTVPTLAELQKRIAESPWVLPVVVDAVTYESAEKEMKAILVSRGYSSIARADLPQRNFMFFGVPIVLAD